MYIKQNAIEFADEYRLAFMAVYDSFYVDDKPQEQIQLNKQLSCRKNCMCIPYSARVDSYFVNGIQAILKC